MRFTKYLGIVLLMCYLGISLFTGHAYAAAPAPTPSPDPTDPYQISGCEPDPSEDNGVAGICHVRYDIVNSRLKPSQTDTTTGFHPLIGLEKIANMVWAGVVKPAGNNYQLGTVLSKPYGGQVEDASFQDLTPANLQDITIHNNSPMKYCVTSRLCVANPVTGGLAGDFITERTWCTEDDVPGAKPQTDGTQRLASYTTRYVNPSQNFTKPDIRVKKMLPPECGAKADGDPIDQSTITTIRENLFSDQDKTSIPYTITPDMQTEQTFTDKLGNLITKFIAKFPVPATHVAGGKLPFAAQNLCNGAGCPNAADLDPALELTDAKKQTLQTGGGWINSMYRSDAFDPDYTAGLNAKFIGQEFEALFTKVNTADTTVYAMRREEESQTFANCNLLTDAEQKLERNQNINCNKNWVGQAKSTAGIASPIIPRSEPNTSVWALNSSAGTAASSPISPNFPPPSGNLQSAIAAQSNRIPQCVLEAIAQIESDNGATSKVDNMGNYSPTGKACGPDMCSSVGVFQITTGVGPSGDPKCKACGTGSCPNALPYIPRVKSAADLCNNTIAVAAAVDLLIGKSKAYGPVLTAADPKAQKNAIIAAGDSYNGTANVRTRLKSTTGQSLSYGEFVYAHCDPTYTTHVEHALGGSVGK